MAQSNETTIAQMNTTIARFMDINPIPAGAMRLGDIKPPNESIVFLNYHSDWNKLMAVGKKIRDILQDMIKQRPPHTACNGDLIEVDISCAINEYNIEKAHEHMFQFIIWYNQLKQNNDTTKQMGSKKS